MLDLNAIPAGTMASLREVYVVDGNRTRGVCCPSYGGPYASLTEYGMESTIILEDDGDGRIPLPETNMAMRDIYPVRPEFKSGPATNYAALGRQHNSQISQLSSKEL